MKENPDPLWDKLDMDNKFNREGKRVDFALRPQHILPVWSYLDQDVKIVKQGNQFFEEMVKYYDAGQKVTDCDWMCWADGTGRTKKYQTSRQDRSQFVPPIDPNLIGQKMQVLMKQALEELRPFATEEDMLKHIYGQASQEATAFPYGANAPAQLPGNVQVQVPANAPVGMPGYTPGGAPTIPLGTMPGFQPPQAAPQQAWMPPQTSAAPQPAPWTPPQTSAAPVQQTWTPPQQQAAPQQVAPQQTWAPPAQTWAPPAPQQQAWTPPAPQQQTWTPPAPQQPAKVEIPNAPVASAPVYAPPPQPQQVSAPPATPADVVLDFGKHQGKSLGWIRDNDSSYLSFLKGNRKELIPAIEAMLGGTSVPTQGPAKAAPQAAPSGDMEAMRAQLVKEINQKIMSVPEFQGAGIHANMMPFLQATIGTTNFSDAPLDQLQALKAAVDTKLAPRA
jgi:hypothetical protein